jgi:hypothetical protein
MTTEATETTVKSADRALAIIEFVADRGSVRFQDIISDCRLPAAQPMA